MRCAVWLGFKVEGSETISRLVNQSQEEVGREDEGRG